MTTAANLTLAQALAQLPQKFLPAVARATAAAREAWLSRERRERVVLLLALVAACAALIDRGLWAPAEASRKQLQAQVTQVEGQRSELQRAAVERKRNAARLLAQEDALRARIERADAELALLRQSVTPADQMLKRLRQFSTVQGSGSERLKLVGLTLEAAEPVLVSHPAAANAVAGNGNGAPASPGTSTTTTTTATTATATATAATADGPALYRLPVVVTVEGDYAAIASYLSQLEASSGGLRWRSLELQTRNWPSLRLKLRVFTLGEQASWPI